MKDSRDSQTDGIKRSRVLSLWLNFVLFVRNNLSKAPFIRDDNVSFDVDGKKCVTLIPMGALTADGTGVINGNIGHWVL